jgi:hypothetical protein
MRVSPALAMMRRLAVCMHVDQQGHSGPGLQQQHECGDERAPNHTAIVLDRARRVNPRATGGPVLCSTERST